MRALGRLVVAAEHRAMKTSASASRYLAFQTPCAMAKTVVRGLAGGGGGAKMPPFARIPVNKEPLHEEDELIWDDGVAPETALDFEAPHWSTGRAVKYLMGGFSFFFLIYCGVKISDPEGRREAMKRVENLPPTSFNPVDIFDGRRELMLSPSTSAVGVEEEDE